MRKKTQKKANDKIREEKSKKNVSNTQGTDREKDFGAQGKPAGFCGVRTTGNMGPDEKVKIYR